MYFCRIVLAICLPSVLGSDFNIRPEGNPVVIHSKNGDVAMLKGAKLFYKDAEGELPTAEDYLFEIINDRYPFIVDMLGGRVSSIELADVDENKGNELLVYYFAGGNQYGPASIKRMEKMGHLVSCF